MLKIEKFVTPSPDQLEIVMEGMRNPMNSWDRMDSYITNVEDYETLETGDSKFIMGDNDYNLAKRLRDGGPVHAKYRRMLPVWVTLTAPLYWWKEFDTYGVGVVRNSCSTMHKIHAKVFALEDFSCEYLIKESIGELQNVIDKLNYFRDKFINWKESDFFIDNDQQLVDRDVIWRQMIQLLPSSYNQKRTVMLNYEVLANIYQSRKNHKLDEWHTFCHWIEELPYSELITGYEE